MPGIRTQRRSDWIVKIIQKLCTLIVQKIEKLSLIPPSPCELALSDGAVADRWLAFSPVLISACPFLFWLLSSMLSQLKASHWTDQSPINHSSFCYCGLARV